MGFEIENGVLKKYTEEPGITEVVIPDSVTSIGSFTFVNCNNLTIHGGSYAEKYAKNNGINFHK